MIAAVIRPVRVSDLAYVTDSWAKNDHEYRKVRTSVAVSAIRERLAGDRVEIRVATLPDDEDAILGWAVVTPPNDRSAIVHYVYVRRDARLQGVARALLSDLEGADVVYQAFPPMHARLPKCWRRVDHV